nr:hypothetical protein [Tanacetum cinerariifolium]
MEVKFWKFLWLLVMKIDGVLERFKQRRVRKGRFNIMESAGGALEMERALAELFFLRTYPRVPVIILHPDVH